MSERPAKPATPEEATNYKRETYPKTVFAAFNQLLSQRKVGNREITISQPEVVSLMVTMGLKKEEIYSRGWLNIDDLYEEAGWNVTRSGSDTDEAITHFTFTPKKAE